MSRTRAAALFAALAVVAVWGAMSSEGVVSGDPPGRPRVVAGDEVILAVQPFDAAKDVRPVHVAVYKPVGPSGPVTRVTRITSRARSGTLGRVVRRLAPLGHETAAEGAHVFPIYEVTTLEGANAGVGGFVSRRDLKTLPPG